MGFQYRFLDRWHVPADPALTWDVLGGALLDPRWWRSFCLAAEGDAGPPEPGRRVRLLVRPPPPGGLTPVARPLLRSNHTWSMRRGQREIVPWVADPDPVRREVAATRSG
jgi:hypothetical protein